MSGMSDLSQTRSRNRHNQRAMNSACTIMRESSFVLVVNNISQKGKITLPSIKHSGKKLGSQITAICYLQTTLLFRCAILEDQKELIQWSTLRIDTEFFCGFWVIPDLLVTSMNRILSPRALFMAVAEFLLKKARPSLVLYGKLSVYLRNYKRIGIKVVW